MPKFTQAVLRHIDPIREPINLHGFYITPFGKKDVTIAGSGATTAINKSVDFEVVIDIVNPVIRGHVPKTFGWVMYKPYIMRWRYGCIEG